MQESPQLQPPKSRHAIKRILIVFGALIVISLVGFGTVYTLSRVIPAKQDAQQAKSPKEIAAAQAKQSLSEATSSEAKGETDAALAKYKEALSQYQKAGDKAGEEAIKLQISYLESVKNPSKDTPTATTVLDPTASESYTTAIPSNTP